MANTLGIPERTLAQISAASNSINVIGGADGRLSAYQPLVCRITDHQDNDASETGTDTEKMALFYSRRHGEPWIKDANVLEHVVIKADADPVTNATPANVSVLFPNFDYTTFE
jgi:hypothetical protein